MDTNVMSSVIQMDPETLNELLLEVKEIIATGIALDNSSSKRFTAAQAWNIRKDRPTAINRLRRW